MNSLERLRLATKVARLYYEQRMKQPEIARQLCLSQAMVSRLLATAQKEGIVRTTVMTPTGVYSELEDELAVRYDLKDAVVADSAAGTGDDVLRAIGSTAASYLEVTLGSNEIVGISSWSETLLRTVASMQPRSRSDKSHVVQILGGIGAPTVEVHAIQFDTANGVPFACPTSLPDSAWSSVLPTGRGCLLDRAFRPSNYEFLQSIDGGAGWHRGHQPVPSAGRKWQRFQPDRAGPSEASGSSRRYLRALFR